MKKILILFLGVFLLNSISAVVPEIIWESPTPIDGDSTINNYVYLNTTTIFLTLRDDFNDESWDTSKTIESTHESSNVTEINERREHHCIIADVSAYYRTNETYIPENRDFIIQITQHANDAGFKLSPTDANGHKWDVYSEADWYNFQMISGNKISPNKKIGADSIIQVGGDCSVTAPYWLRMRVNETSISFDYANMLSIPSEYEWITCSSETWESGMGAIDSVGQYAYVTNYNSGANGVLYSDNLKITGTSNNDISAWFDWNKSLRGYLAMDFYNSTGVFDNSTYNNFGIFYNMSEDNQTTGKYGNAFYFSGNDYKSYIDMGNDSSLIISDKLSLDLWVKPEPGQEHCYDAGSGWGNTGIVGSVDGADSTSTWSYQLRYGSADNCSLGLQLNTGLGSKWVNVGYNLSTSEWTHIVVTFNGTDEKLYVNGVLTDNLTFVSTTLNTNSNNKVLLGSAGWGVSNTYYNGSVDEFKIYNRALSQEEINASYNNSIYRLSHNFINLNDGNYNYSAYVIDTLGNLEITNEREITILTTPLSKKISLRDGSFKLKGGHFLIV